MSFIVCVLHQSVGALSEFMILTGVWIYPFWSRCVIKWSDGSHIGKLCLCVCVCALLHVSPSVSSEYEWVSGSLCVFLCVCVSVQRAPLSVCRGSHGPGKGLSTEAIKQYVCWNNVFDLAVGQQQVLGGPAWSCCSPPALICRPGTSPPLSVAFLPIASLSSSFLVFVPLFLSPLSVFSYCHCFHLLCLSLFF